MRRTSMLIAFSLAAALAGGAAWADRPGCPSEAGACFIDLGPYWGVIRTEDNGSAWSYGDDFNDFILLAGSRVRVHGIYMDAPQMYCPPDVVTEGLCDPTNPDPRVFLGTGRTQVNLDIGPDGFAGCPAELHTRGLVYSPGGAAFHLAVDFVKVRDPHSESGCRDVQREIVLTLLP